ncbi:LysR family transcriptional regulator [Hespellia stercorisuis]|uniref:DNA-binding transcriptional regulator, LysR family n=1 Tax=Hespellia stercorisuis DSM 15480 TaxID=1121950 RepID=A0A1M6S3X5_9FIRM|nr:LysR family transcriptional regulator [Hespellia stercorisuis]SHK39453.1 DNA-binding transcriptional regulator, LysR family [Hespellia stercorisuis DSM 15480]
MDQKEAAYMISIYKNKNITKAARELYISQPSLSRYLQNVEQHLGFPLFNRIGNEYLPTYNGQRYLDYASRILQVGNEWEKECLELKNEQRGKLTIALPLMRSSCMIPETFPLFHQKYPEVSLTLFEEAYAISEQLLLTDTVDFAVYNPPEFSKALEYIPLRFEPFVLVCRKGHPIEKLAKIDKQAPYPVIDLADCREESFILHVPEQNSGHVAMKLFEQQNYAPHILLQTHSTQVAISLASSGMGLAFAPETYVHKMQQTLSLSCFCVGSPPAQVQLMAAYRRGKYLPAYAQYYIELLKAL